MNAKRLSAALVVLTSSLVFSSCNSPGEVKTRSSESRLVGAADHLKTCQARLDEAKEELLSGNDKKGYWLLRSLNYFALSKNQQEQCDILWRRWKRYKSADFSEKYKASTWEALRTYRDINLVVLDIKNQAMERAQLELRLRNYQVAESQLRALLKSPALSKTEKKFCQACVEILESAIRESRIPHAPLLSAEDTQAAALKDSSKDPD